MNPSRQREWSEAQRRCRLSVEAIAMAKELGLTPRALTRNIPNRGEPWKAPVEDWVRRMHAKRFGQRPPPRTSPPGPRVEAEAPEPSDDTVDELAAAKDALMAKAASGEIESETAFDQMERLDYDAPVSGGEIAEENRILLRRRDSFRRFADLFAGIAAKLDFVQRVVLFGSVAAPLKKELPRFARLRRARIAVWHECKDVDLAIWVSDLTRLRELKRAVADATNMWQAIANVELLPGIPHHQVDVFIMEPLTGRYRGNLCRFGQCPKGKPECEVAGCGAQSFLQLYEDFEFDRRAPFDEHAVVLFDRFSPAVKT